MKAEDVYHWFNRQRWGTRLAIAAALAVGILLGTLVSNGVRAARDGSGNAGTPLAIPSPMELSTAFSKVAKQVEPAVVNISTDTIVRPSERRSQPQSPEDFFERFFDFGPPRSFRESSLGSGVIVDASGYILTNHHVVRQADRIAVRVHGDSKDYKAELVGYDQETDLAVIKINSNRPLPVAELGNSDSVQVGDWVLAVGSPFGFDATVTAGIISYKGREVPGSEQFQRFLQTDAAINRGNSGGPLVNLAGQVIGINTMIATSSGANAGIGFAMPSNIAREVYNQIRAQGRVVRGSIGVESVRRSDTEREVLLRSFGADSGYIVDGVQPGSPAERAGLQRGDVITEVNGQRVQSGEELVDLVAATPVGQEVRLTVVRAKKKQSVSVRVEDRCKVFPDRCGEPQAAAESEAEAGRLGLRVEEITPGLLQRWGLDPEQDQGLVVREVEPGGFADEAGLVRGDVIVEINQRRLRTLEEFRAVERGLRSGDDVVFGIKRRVQERWLWIYLGRTLP